MHPLQYYLATLGDELLEFHGNASTLINGAVADSRKVRPGFLFVAVPGVKTDGSLFAHSAVEAGANTVVATKRVDLPEHANLVLVKNAYVAAARIAEAAAGYPARSFKMIGVTGTNGKTTCTYLLRDILKRAGWRTGMIGTVQYEVGDERMMADRTTPMPFALQDILKRMRAAGTEIAVAETSSHALHQRRPGTARFSGALFTNLTGDHCDYHITMENYFAAKQVLFTEYLRTRAPAVINIDDAYGRQLVDNLTELNHGQIITFGTSQDADWRIERWQAGLDGIRMDLAGPEAAPVRYAAPVVGGFNIYNVAGAAVLASYLGAAEEDIQYAVSHFRGAPGRMEAVEIGAGITAFVDYAHTDDALANVLEAVRNLNPKRVLVLFGCGGDRDRTKRKRMGKVAGQLADKVYVTSDNPRGEDPVGIIEEIVAGIPAEADVLTFVDRREAIRQAIADAEAGDVLLVAGKGHETYQEIKGEKFPFDDREELRCAAK